jgi:hypothetical protein
MFWYASRMLGIGAEHRVGSNGRLGKRQKEKKNFRRY